MNNLKNMKCVKCKKTKCFPFVFSEKDNKTYCHSCYLKLNLNNDEKVRKKIKEKL